MSSLRNAVQRRAHKERAQPKKRFGLLEKHKDYVLRAKAFHKKEDYLQKLKEKAANRNPDEFYFKMINSKTVDGVHKSGGDSNKYTEEELLLMKTQDIGYILQKLQAEKKKIERLTATLHSLDSQPSNKHVYYAEDREDAKRILSETKSVGGLPTFEDLPESIKRKTASSYRQLEDRKNRVQELEKIYNEMALKQELRKRVKNESCVKTRSCVQLLDQYTSGEPNVNVKLRLKFSGSATVQVSSDVFCGWFLVKVIQEPDFQLFLGILTKFACNSS